MTHSVTEAPAPTTAGIRLDRKQSMNPFKRTTPCSEGHHRPIKWDSVMLSHRGGRYLYFRCPHCREHFVANMAGRPDPIMAVSVKGRSLPSAHHELLSLEPWWGPVALNIPTRRSVSFPERI